ncbi:hypothetical protein TRIUR3_20021 [Triticum urartu]|uniref:HMA domain-containing protein n=1 Tax=Triticum urartu TaxID=4572 RepID=M8A5C8_TRIUA|nr:hypothetical protein TRIUR3_20021 [Triticum urartu]
MGRKLGLERVLDCFSLSVCANACVCVHAVEDEDEENEGKALVSAQLDELHKLKDFGGGAKTLAFHLEPKTVELRVSMHCYGCARKVQKHISKMEGVSSFEVDLENKKVVVTGDVTPYEVLQSVSKVMKFAELLVAPNFADLQGGSPKVKPLPLNQSDRDNTPDTQSNFRSGTPPRLRRRRRKPYLPSTNHEPSTRFRLPDVVDADYNLHPLLDYLPNSTSTLEQTSSQRWSPRTQIHHKNDVAATPSLLT